MDLINELPDNDIVDKKRHRWILAAVSIGTFMSGLDSSVVNIAIPNIQTYFNTSMLTVQWIAMSYLLIISSLLLLYGRIGDMYGHKRVYLTGFIVFTVGSVLCGISPSIIFLILFRIIQALGAGMLMAMGPAIVTHSSPLEERGKSLGITAAAVAISLTAGPVIGGFLTARFGWQSIFFINLPVGILGILLANKVIPDISGHEKQPFDIKGAVIIFVSLIFLLLPISFAENYGWENPYIIIGVVFGLIGVFAFIWVEKHEEYPMMDLTLFRNRLFSMGNLSALLNYMAQFSVVFLMPFYLQKLRMIPISEAGMLIAPMPLTTMLIAPISGIISDKFNTRYISSAGMGIIALGMWQLSGLSYDSSYFSIITGLIIIGLGVGLFQTPNNSAIMGAVPPNRRGVASGIMATMRNIGMVMGIAVSGAIFSTHMTHISKILYMRGLRGENLRVEAFTGALSLAYITAAILACIAVATSLVRGSTKE